MKVIAIWSYIDPNNKRRWVVHKYDRPKKIEQWDFRDSVHYTDWHNLWNEVGRLAEGEDIKKIKVINVKRKWKL